ncbi:MAG: Gfo/Idh/MocA family oxidoreductase [Prolixibacteraceae bacterium]|jgi:predicted dehydrogenase|nr:Gfo/Idh/MocA family oxidoreductase [Prolixibacteraceae bacterium]
MMQKKFTFGIIGAGMIAEKHIEGLQKTEQAEIKWIARKDDTKLVEIQKKYGIPYGTTNFEEMLEDDTVEAVVITSPPALHYEHFKKCVAAGKHILLEKPAAIKREHIDEMVEIAEAHPELIISDCSARHARLQPKFKVVKDIIDSGKLGEVYFIHHNAVARQARPGIEYHPTAKWFLNKEIAGGGVLFDWGVYDLSFHLGLLNDWPEVEDAELIFMKNGLDKIDPETDIFDVEEHFAAHLKLSGGIRYYWERAANANMEAINETRIYGTCGGIKLSFCSWDNPNIEFFDVEDEGKGKARKETISVDMAGHDDNDALSAHFVRVLNGEEKVLMPLRLACKHLDVIYRLYS